MKATANEVKAGHTVQPRDAKRSDAKAVIAPKPKLLSAKPTPGTHTAASTVVKGAWTRPVGATRLTGAANRRVASGTSVVASAIAGKPWAPYRDVPIGAPSAKAPHIPAPIQTRTLPGCWAQASPRP